ncbi:MAG: hypothetical protein QF554_04895 [Dehalococcoidia bacterium]|jgi:hypothetical protein|nr:hypothetical protein [Dehalococcoidia bacterium]
MKKFIVIYHATTAAMEQTQSMSQEEMKDGMDRWFAWAENAGDALVDFGSPLMGGVKLSPSGSTPSDHGVMGYSILEAMDMEAAQAVLAGHPHLGWADGCELEVHEAVAMPAPG